MDTAVATPEAVAAAYRPIPIDQINPSPHQARKDFDEESLQGLAESMKQEGLLEPIIVRQAKGSYELISGERRWRAAKLLGWELIEAKIITTISEAEAAAKGMVENLQREDLNPIEEAEGFKELNQLDPDYWNQPRIGNLIGKRKDYVSRSLALLGLPEPILAELRQRNLSREHGIELLRINNANSQKSMANKAVKGQWSVKQTRVAIDKLEGKKKSSQPAARSLPLEEGFQFEQRGDHMRVTAWFPMTLLEESIRDYRMALSHWCLGHGVPFTGGAERGMRNAEEGTLDEKGAPSSGRFPPPAPRTPHPARPFPDSSSRTPSDVSAVVAAAESAPVILEKHGMTAYASNKEDAEAMLKKIEEIEKATE